MKTIFLILFLTINSLINQFQNEKQTETEAQADTLAKDSVFTAPDTRGEEIDSTIVETTVPVPPVFENKAFEIGERLCFKIRYGFVKAGSAEMKVLPLKEMNQRQVYHIQTTAKSVAAFSWIYKVNDVINSFVDYQSFYPVRFEKKLREGSYKADVLVDYFHEDSLAKVEYIRYESNMKIKKRNMRDVEIPPFAQDILSSFYSVRNKDIQVGKSIYITNHEKYKVYNLEVKVHKREVIEVEAGKFRCLLIEPILKEEGVFKQKGSLRIWLTDDERKIPVQMKSKVLVGHITAELTKIKGVTKEIKARIK